MMQTIGQIPVLVILLCLLVSCFHQSNCFDYCKVKCLREGATHTMCKYSGGVASTCTQYDKTKSSLTQADKEAILDSHNKHRSHVAQGKQANQPSAANMMELVWDAEVEEFAQRWADQCAYKHDDCRDTKDGTYGGQNLAINSDTSAANSNHVDAWYEEVKDFNKEWLGSYQDHGGAATGHYTQVVWAKTKKIGCAKSVFMYPNYNRVSVMMVCNYAPGGNILQERIYEEGEACSKCPSGTKCSKKYPGLCENPETNSFAGSDAHIIKLDIGLMVSFILLTKLYNY